MIYLIVEILARLIDAGILFAIILMICQPRFRDPFSTVLSSLIVCILYSSAFLIIDRYKVLPFATITIRILIIYLLSFFVCKHDPLLQLLAMNIAVFMTFTLDCIIQFSLAILIGHSSDIHSSLSLLYLPSNKRSLLLLISKMILCAAFLSLRKVYPRFRSLSRESSIILTLILLLSNIISVYLIHLILSWSALISQLAVILSWVFITLSVSAAISTVLVVNGLQKERIERDMMIAMNESISNTYETVIAKNEELKRQAHDFSHHLSAIRRMDQDLIYPYIDEVLGRQSYTDKAYASGDPYIDAVINGKSVFFSEKNILFSLHVMVPTKLPFPASDICSIVSNQLDNAIEACEKITDPDSRWIDYTIDRNNSFVTMICKNSISPDSVDADSSLLTTKKSSSSHGYGLRNIQTCAERNHGILINEICPTSFSSKVILEIE